MVSVVPKLSDSELLSYLPHTPASIKPKPASTMKTVRTDDYSFFKKRVKLNENNKELVIY
jgi:hypothetical protein